MMSTFPGTIHEIPKVSVDRFNYKNLSSELFFLSHFHADHMVGLRNPEFHAVLLRRPSAFIYCSELTALFLSQNHLKGFDAKIKVLAVNKEHTLNISDELGVISVTPLPAGHCPGSVMFLFGYKGLNYLYTGDYRMTKDNIVKLKALRDHDGHLKPIETLYLDTTFFEPAYSYFPSRDESMSELIKMCRSWIAKGDDFVIDIRTPATVGVEYVMIALSKEFGQPLHVSPCAYEKYCRIPELSSAVSLSDESKLHACIPGNRVYGKSLFLQSHKTLKDKNVLSIKLCCLHAKKFSKEMSLVSYSEQQSLYKLVYSSHSSHSELLEMIETLLPSKIVPCVVPSNCTSDEVVELLLSSCNLKAKRNESDSVLQFSSYEDVEDTMEDKKSQEKEDKKCGALLTFSKYNINDSSDENDYLTDQSDDNELPPFSWDCHYDSSKALRKEQQPAKKSRMS
ncbi:Protein artemis [Frankliniella fusca]|uniref:Protein artemis n=1 Tax=Frankliniella fusca TaxID=407009 RepID=A0AAE1H4R8_9NEOP|nr:Protein artemis [Frankliniella fusca]